VHFAKHRMRVTCRVLLAEAVPRDLRTGANANPEPVLCEVPVSLSI
jgi:hypothetical protein